MKKNIPIKSTRKNKKLMVLNDNNKIIHFGYSKMSDFTKHKDKKRQTNYCLRSAAIRDGQGKFTKNNIDSPNYWSMRVLWDCDKRKDLNLGLK